MYHYRNRNLKMRPMRLCLRCQAEYSIRLLELTRVLRDWSNSTPSLKGKFNLRLRQLPWPTSGHKWATLWAQSWEYAQVSLLLCIVLLPCCPTSPSPNEIQGMGWDLAFATFTFISYFSGITGYRRGKSWKLCSQKFLYNTVNVAIK